MFEKDRAFDEFHGNMHAYFEKLTFLNTELQDLGEPDTVNHDVKRAGDAIYTFSLREGATEKEKTWREWLTWFKQGLQISKKANTLELMQEGAKIHEEEINLIFGKMAIIGGEGAPAMFNAYAYQYVPFAGNAGAGGRGMPPRGRGRGMRAGYRGGGWGRGRGGPGRGGPGCGGPMFVPCGGLMIQLPRLQLHFGNGMPQAGGPPPTDRFGNPIYCHACDQPGHRWRYCPTWAAFKQAQGGSAAAATSEPAGYNAQATEDWNYDPNAGYDPNMYYDEW
eukprot:2922591-Rhodomonas_salina.1